MDSSAPFHFFSSLRVVGGMNGRPNISHLSLKPRTHDQINHRFRLRCALLPAMGTGRLDVARGLVRASVVSRVEAVKSSNIKDARRKRCYHFVSRRSLGLL
ncbi:hypothetical protein AVEN_91756-1 [Araneus ventricosus]|uniref:Uncharacterized protein n=1 Tax=Araneus ventricosus TaxID=182803 RepID=A0A4Y2HV67_ARAVE|nr:hypothetical protein AVEN_91756-1 [Araneus ventricosus]